MLEGRSFFNQAAKSMIGWAGLSSCGAALLFRSSWSILACFLFILSAAAEPRFPPPEFVETNHQVPTMTTPGPRAAYWEYVDSLVLAAALSTALWLIYTRRSRRGLIALSIFSLIYFGFYRKGCICSIGSVQNLAMALFDNGYAAPVSAIAFFALPVAVALFSGRAFCSGVCPHGALQDLILVKPLKVPTWLEQGLSVLPFIYLGAGVLFAATGTTFIICQYDPFVPIFRMSGRTFMVLSGVALLVLGMFVGRPYCRFLCPFGAILKLAGTVSARRVRVTPDLCTQCRLCEASCPFGAMRTPETGRPAARDLPSERRQLTLALMVTPLLIFAGAWGGLKFSPTAAMLHPSVNLAHEFLANQGKPAPTGALSPADLELQRARQNPRETLVASAKVQHRFDMGTTLFGGWIGLVIGAKWISLRLRRTRTDYEPDRGDCVACARCFDYCPNELVRRGVISPVKEPATTTL